MFNKLKITCLSLLAILSIITLNAMADQSADPNGEFLELVNKNRNKAKAMVEKDSMEADARFERDYRNKTGPFSSRGGLRELVFLDATKAYAARCQTDNSALLTFDRTPLGQYCGESLIYGYKCFSTPSLTAAHICK